MISVMAERAFVLAGRSESAPTLGVPAQIEGC